MFANRASTWECHSAALALARVTGPGPAVLSLVINLKTPKALGLAVSPSILLRADEVVE
jgi:hypothetical protein